MKANTAGAVAEIIRARVGDFAASPTPPTSFLYMPAGVHTICPFLGDKPFEITVSIGPEAVTALNATLAAHNATGRKPFFCFDHEEKSASFWPESFAWTEAGVIVRGEWSQAGLAAIQGKTHRAFSPAFTTDKLNTTPNSPAHIKSAPLAMGSLVNNQAFDKLPPLWAKNSGDSSAATNPNPNADIMNKLAELKASLAKIEGELNVLKAKAAGEQNAEVLSAKQAALDAVKAQIAAEEALQAANARNAEFEAAEKTRRETLADETISAAQARGVFPAQPAADSADAKEIARWKSLIVADPKNATLLARMAGNPALAGTLTAGSGQNRTIIQLQGHDLDRAIKAYASEKDGMKRGVLYAQAIRKAISESEGFDHVMRAANTLGTAAGELIVQRSLDLLKYTYPLLDRISFDLNGDQAADFNTEINSRTRSVPTLTDYDTTNSTYSTSNTTSTDVPVTIDTHKAIQVSFSVNELATTKRQLFGEQEEGMHYAIGKGLVDALVALITTTNFTNETVVGGSIDFNRAKVIDGKTALSIRKANNGTRTALLSSTYYGQLEKDMNLVGGLTNPNAGGAIQTGMLPQISGFQPVEADYLPTANNLVGFMCRADALVVATRLPNDYTQAFPDVPSTAVVQTITNPDTKVSVMLVKFVNHLGGTATMRLAIMWGVAKGQAACGQRLVSAATS